MTVAGFRSISKLGLMVSFRKSYSSSMGYSRSLHRFLTSFSHREDCKRGIIDTDKLSAHINFGVVDFKCMHVVIVLVDFVCRNRSPGMFRRTIAAQHLPLSTPTIDVKRSPSVAFAAGGTPGRPAVASSRFFSASRVPGITRLPLIGALAVVKPAGLVLSSMTTRASRITLSLSRNWRVSG